MQILDHQQRTSRAAHGDAVGRSDRRPLIDLAGDAKDIVNEN